MITYCDQKRFLTLPYKIVDVRAPVEYAKGHIPLANNIPVLDNENRRLVGIAYKTRGREEAIELGTELLDPLKDSFLDSFNTFCPDKKLRLYCLRGGLRSKKTADFLSLNGFELYVLEGGYKAYRHFAFKTIADYSNLIVLAGQTGSGKTEILNILKERGQKVLDLENLACHRGSAFGGIGQPEQPSTPLFQHTLFETLLKMDKTTPIWVESESLKIGKVSLTPEFWENLNRSNALEIKVSRESRVKTILRDYGNHDTDELINAVTKLERRLGRENTGYCVDLIRNKDLEKAVDILIEYYDRAYVKGRSKHKKQKIEQLELQTDNREKQADMILEKAKELGWI
jgi:tRNA 2-selenouridine synthase